jgi:hypothetical protein
MSATDQSVVTTASDPQGEREKSRRLAERYRCPFVDLFEQRIDPELFRSIPAELMFRFNFVPMEAQGNCLVIAVADPSQVLLSDELPLLLGKKLILKVATPTQIGDLLKRTEQSQRVSRESRPSVRLFASWIPSFLPRSSGVPLTFTSRRETSRLPSNIELTESWCMPWLRYPKIGYRQSSPASRS